MEAANKANETKYERIRKIGIGSYGVVFKCVNRQTGQIVAIKRYSENDTDPVIRKIAMREVRMLRQLKHPNLIQLIEVFRRRRILHLVFDYCELTVLDVIEKYASNCPLNLIRKIIWQLVNGVSHCHSHNCIHRDIKPENILINQAGVVKLCDFGFARNLNPPPGPGSGGHPLGQREAQLLGVPLPAAASSNHHQATNQHHHQLAPGDSVQQAAAAAAAAANQPTSSPRADKENRQLHGDRQALTEYVATRWYRAPELLVGDIYYDTKIDIWAIGCVTAELMRGEPLWPGKTDLDQLCLIKNSLGQLTAEQGHNLLTRGLYEQAKIEKVLGQTEVLDSLGRKLPTRVGQLGADFVLACLQMDPSKRPTSDDLLLHPYIQSALMGQFVRGASHAVPQVPTRHHHHHHHHHNHNHNHNHNQSELNGHRSLTHMHSTGGAGGAPQQVSLQTMHRSNSQAILRAANSQQQQQPASKRLVLGTGDHHEAGRREAASLGLVGATINQSSMSGDNKYASRSLIAKPARGGQSASMSGASQTGGAQLMGNPRDGRHCRRVPQIMQTPRQSTIRQINGNLAHHSTTTTTTPARAIPSPSAVRVPRDSLTSVYKPAGNARRNVKRAPAQATVATAAHRDGSSAFGLATSGSMLTSGSRHNSPILVGVRDRLMSDRRRSSDGEQSPRTIHNRLANGGPEIGSPRRSRQHHQSSPQSTGPVRTVAGTRREPPGRTSRQTKPLALVRGRQPVGPGGGVEFASSNSTRVRHQDEEEEGEGEEEESSAYASVRMGAKSDSTNSGLSTGSSSSLAATRRSKPSPASSFLPPVAR